jgi:hypothetical protein
VAIALAVVIAVEKVCEGGVERLMARDIVAKDECFEKPGRVREVPFGWRSVREWLDRRVSVGKRRGEVERQLARRGEAIAKA